MRSLLSVQRRLLFLNLAFFYNADIICASETWFDCNVKNPFLDTNYVVVARADRQYGSHGGVLILAKNYLMCKEINLNVDFATACRVSTISSSILIAVFYNPPEKSPNRLTEACILKVFDVLRCHAKTLDQLIIFGDFNYPNIDWESLTAPENDGSDFCSCLFKHSLLQLVNEPTHKSGSLLDLVITNTNKSQIREVNNKDFSDHRCICVTTNASLLKSVSPITGKVQQYSFSQENVESLRLSFAQNFFSYLLQQNETFTRNCLFNFFSILNQFIPKNVPAGNNTPLTFPPTAFTY